jgi:surface carbohydrate biosynthesis protein
MRYDFSFNRIINNKDVVFYKHLSINQVLCKKLGINYNLIDQKINIYFFLKNIFSLSFYLILKRFGLSASIIYLYIKENKPKFILTFVDNDINFYIYKKFFKNIFFISIQNGIRNKFYDLPGHPQLKNLAKKDLLSCDYMFVFGTAYKDFISKYIKSKFVISGSFFNNFKKKFELNNNQKKILIISQFRDKNQLIKSNILINGYYSHFGLKTKISIKDINSVYYYLGKVLSLVCKKFNIEILVLGASKKYFENEKKFFLQAFKNFRFKFIKNTNSRNQFSFIDRTNLVISSGSTLGHESLSRNKNTLFVPTKRRNFFRDQKQGDDLWCGPFWPEYTLNPKLLLTFNNLNEDFQRITSLLFVKKQSCMQKDYSSRLRHKLIYYDYNNLKLINKLKEIINLH